MADPLVADPLEEAIRQAQADIRAGRAGAAMSASDLDHMADRLMETAWYGKSRPSQEAYGAVAQALHNAAAGEPEAPLPDALFAEASYLASEGPAADMQDPPPGSRVKGGEDTDYSDEEIAQHEREDEAARAHAWRGLGEEEEAAERSALSAAAGEAPLLGPQDAELRDRERIQRFMTAQQARSDDRRQAAGAMITRIMEDAQQPKIKTFRQRAAQQALGLRPNADLATDRPFLDATHRWVQPVKGGMLRTEDPGGFD